MNVMPKTQIANKDKGGVKDWYKELQRVLHEDHNLSYNDAWRHFDLQNKGELSFSDFCHGLDIWCNKFDRD